MERYRDPKRALFLRLPEAEAQTLDEASQRLGTPKYRLVADLVASHLAADDPPAAIGALKGASVGRAFVSNVPEAEVLTLEQLAELLSLDVETARALAEAGEFPGRKLGDDWRFSRRAIIDWLRGE